MKVSERLAKMINVKSIISILFSVVFCYLSVIGVISGQSFLTIFTVIISFYFGTQQNNGVKEKE